MPENHIDLFHRTYADQLREMDTPPATLKDWQTRRSLLREKILEAAGVEKYGEKVVDPEVTLHKTLERDGYKIELLTLKTRPSVYATATAYVPNLKKGEKVPAVLVVHGHWAWARRDPVVQARCLGLVHLGFFVLAIDAFGSGERFTTPRRGSYHGALYGASLWPTGNTLLGMQLWDNRVAVDYLSKRPEVNGKFGITGASGGGNQSMYAGALDERFLAVVPVCSVGNYRAYLQAACCVCEVLPNALTFTEEGDVLGLVAPRALHVMNAEKDAIQFSPAEAKKSVARAQAIFSLYGKESHLAHTVFEGGHDYNKPMREAMYGWMTLHLKGEGKGEPIPEPKHTIEKPEDLACYPDPDQRPKDFSFPPTFAAMAGKARIATVDKLRPDHPEMWQATREQMLADLKKVLGPFPRIESKNEPAESQTDQTTQITTQTWVRLGEGKIPLKIETLTKANADRSARMLVLHPEGSAAAKQHPFVQVQITAKKTVLLANLRGQGETKSKWGAYGGAPDHTLAEHGYWVGRSLLNQWVTDTLTVLEGIGGDPEDKAKLTLVGIGPFGLVAALAAAVARSSISELILIDSPTSFVNEKVLATGTFMGLLVPGILKVGDVPHLLSLVAPEKLTIQGGHTADGTPLDEKGLQKAFEFTTTVYKAVQAEKNLKIIRK
ncbi:MAG: hypothetical protein N2112_16460 [Gemmataceae bacterium]|nr:hypothetical protein [Gemmataceae bacterium]